MGKITLFMLLGSILVSSQAEELKVVIERNVPVPIRDGTILRADVHRPNRGDSYPVLVLRTPYGKDRTFDRFVKAGYIVVSQDVRGRYESQGRWEHLRRFETHDDKDGYDTIEWAAKLAGSTGKVGTFGISYDAFLQWRLAVLNPPSLVCMSACSIPARLTDMSPGSIRPGFRLNWWARMALDMRKRDNIPGIHTEWEFFRLWRYEAKKWIDWLPWLELPSDFFGYETEAVKAWMENPNIDPWKLHEGCKSISVPNLDIVGWYDHGNGDMLLYQTMAKNAKTAIARNGSHIVIGPWSHGGYGRRSGRFDFGPNAELDKVSLQIRWFDYWLKGEKNGFDKDTPVKIFVMGDNKWRDEQYWPPKRAESKVMYITCKGSANTQGGDGALVGSKPQLTVSDNYVYDPSNPVPTPYGSRRPVAMDQRVIADRKDVLVYQSEPLTERIEVTGNPVVELYAASSAFDTDWFVKLIDIAPDGVARDVSSGMIRARYRNGFDKPELLKPGKVEKYVIRMNPTSNAFLPGHRICLYVTSSDFPNFDRNHNTAVNQNADTKLVIANQVIYHGGDQATRIILPVINDVGLEYTEKSEEDQSQSVSTPLHDAVTEGNIENVKQLLSKDCNIESKDSKGSTPLHIAARLGHKEITELLISKGANIHEIQNNEATPLHEAAWFGRKDVVEVLLRNGADVHALQEGWTPLHNAVCSKNVDIVKLLITSGAEINIKNDKGYVPLQFSILYDTVEISKVLINAGADISMTTDFVRHIVSSGDKDAIFQFIIDNGKVNSKENTDGITPLQIAVTEDKKKVAELLIANEARIDERDNTYSFTALHYAARFGNKDIAEYLISKGADIHAVDKWNYQPIHWAAYHDRYEVVELLISNGADVNAKTSLGQTPLELAKPRRNTATIEVLHKHGAKE